MWIVEYDVVVVDDVGNVGVIVVAGDVDVDVGGIGAFDDVPGVVAGVAVDQPQRHTLSPPPNNYQY